MEIPTQQNHVYTLTCDNACEVYDVDTDRLIHVHHAGEVQSQFTAIGMKSRTSDDTAHITELFNGAPAGNGGGGYIESNLNVGHGAADAVAAVCTLTLGDTTAEGDLTDNAEHALHLDAQPALQSHGVLTVADATESGTLSIGGEVVENFVEKKETPASISLELLVDVSELHGDYGFGLQYNGELWCTFATYITYTTGEALAEELGNAERWKLPDGTALGFAPVEATWDSTTEKITMACTAKQGADGDNVAVEDGPKCPFIVPQDAPSFSGGQDARTMEEALAYVEGVVNNYDGLEAEVDAENNAVLVTASEPGAAGDLLALGFEGDLLEVTEQMDGGQDARTYAEVIAAINGDDGVSAPTYPFGAKAEATETEGVITLTANTPGAAANAITYTATGCFGSGTVKQGSTTRGKNAVAQTAFKIYLNGEELDVEPAPTSEPLEEDTEMKNHGVYTVAAAGTALNYSAVTTGVNATARIWLDYNDTTDVTWPPEWVWLTEDGLQPDFDFFKRFKLEIENDTVATTAKLVDSYATAPEYAYTPLTSNDNIPGAPLNLLSEYTSSTGSPSGQKYYAYTPNKEGYWAYGKTGDDKYGTACELSRAVALKAWLALMAVHHGSGITVHIEGFDDEAGVWKVASAGVAVANKASDGHVPYLIKTNVELSSTKWRLVASSATLQLYGTRLFEI